jgi:uncharacterized membrane protein YjgN (DUF898 family)
MKSWRFRILSALVKENLRNRYLPSATGGLKSYLFDIIRVINLSKRCSDRQTLSSFGSSSVNDSPATFGRHPFQETVISSSFYLAWLIRSFHCLISLLLGHLGRVVFRLARSH